MALTEGLPDSPRISFSHDLSQNDAVPVPIPYIRSNSSSTVDFDFCVVSDQDSSSSAADELFSDGKILPIQIKNRPSPPKLAPPRMPPPPPPRRTHEPVPAKCPDSPSEGEEKQNCNKPSFWRIKRSTSLNCGSGYGRTLCPLPILSRSNSTGSTSSSSSVKRSPNVPNNSKQNFAKHSGPKQPSSSSKPPLKKSSHGNNSYSGGVGVKFNPILNVVPPANLFGLGSIFSGSRKK